MRPLREAQREVLAAMGPLPVEEAALEDCLGLVLAGDVRAAHDVPPFANSGMDGFAVRSADVSDPPVELRVLEDVPAGSVPRREVASGTATRIMTGAPMPAGADAVVMVEQSEPVDEETVRLLGSAEAGQHVRPAGGDIAAGETVLATGTRLSPAAIGLLASVGSARVRVRRRPVVAVMSTGDELVPADAGGLRPGSIHDSNRPMLAALLRELGATVLDLGIVPDDERLLRSTLGEAAAGSDAVVTSGGVSMGDYDLVKQVLGDLGRVDFWQVAMQPAKPFAFGFLGKTPFFGLPGNPVSVVVAYEQFVRPAILRRMGARRLFRRRSRGVAGTDLATNPEKVVFLRVEVRGDESGDVAVPSGGQGSNVLSSLARADAFAVVPVGVGTLPEGDPVELEWFRAPEAWTMEEALGG